VLSSTNYGWRRRKFHPAEPRPGRELSFRSEKLLAVGSVYHERAMSARHLDGANAAMERYARGDEAAFADVYDAIAPRLLHFLRKATRDPFAAEDLMQQTLLHMHGARIVHPRRPGDAVGLRDRTPTRDGQRAPTSPGTTLVLGNSG